MKLRYLLIVLLLFICAYPIKALDTTSKLYDNADIYSDIEESSIKEKINDYIEKYDMDLVIVTTSINTYNDTETFEAKFYQDNNFGITSKKNGTILAIDLDNNKYEFISYGEMQRYLDDKRIDEVYDYVDQMYVENNKDYFVLATSFIDRLDYYVSQGIPNSNKNTYVSSDGVMHEKHVFPYFITIGISLVISLVVVLIFAHKTKMIKKATEANNYVDKSHINITNRRDIFITTNTTRVRKPDNNSGSGSGRVGGTSISHSGGGSHSSGHGGRSL